MTVRVIRTLIISGEDLVEVSHAGERLHVLEARVEASVGDKGEAPFFSMRLDAQEGSFDGVESPEWRWGGGRDAALDALPSAFIDNDENNGGEFDTLQVRYSPRAVEAYRALRAAS